MRWNFWFLLSSPLSVTNGKVLMSRVFVALCIAVWQQKNVYEIQSQTEKLNEFGKDIIVTTVARVGQSPCPTPTSSYPPLLKKEEMPTAIF